MKNQTVSGFNGRPVAGNRPGLVFGDHQSGRRRPAHRGAAATGKAFEEGIELATALCRCRRAGYFPRSEIVFEDTAGGTHKAAERGSQPIGYWDKVVMVGDTHHRPPWPRSNWPTARDSFHGGGAWPIPSPPRTTADASPCRPSNSGARSMTSSPRWPAEQLKKSGHCCGKIPTGATGIAAPTEKSNGTKLVRRSRP